ncbi:heterokaryon incompatibility protein-domain-containing protein [Xylaria arbuscula]|nr:heterokaryon incompatibility protein-domain-containing protein [Xylaria arbuscula]
MDIDDLPEAVLCEVCASIFSDNSYERWAKFWQIWKKIHSRPWADLQCHLPSPGRHHRTEQSWDDARTLGCHICSQLSEIRGSFPLRYNIYCRNESASSRKCLYYILRLYTDQGRSTYSGRFEIVSGLRQSVSQKSKIQYKGRFWTGHENIAAVAGIWLDECRKNHATCSKSFSKAGKPSRLLDVSEDDIRLMSGEQANTEEHYVTLSHCWGKEEFLVLTADLLPRFLAGVHISAFPLTFQETIITVRRLGLRYLWIDCYCILQGDDEAAEADWKKESLRMGTVYANALLNIGALESSGPADGLFRDSLPSRIRSATIHWCSTRRDGTTLFRVTEIRYPYSSFLYDTNIAGIMRSNLMRRGWVLQECIMAPRMLSFGQSQVFWQCSELAASEGIYIFRTPPENSPIPSLDLPFGLFNSPGSRPQLNHYNINDRWIETLKTYCLSRLTYPEKDLFVALDGVGAELAKLSGSRFESGTLASTLPEILLYEPTLFRESYTTERGKPGRLPKHDDINRTEQEPIHKDEDLNYIVPSHSFKRDKTRPTWHWSSCYPNVGFRLVLAYSTSEPNFRVAYAFVSDDCKLSNPFDQSSKHYWPNLLLIGRLMTELPPNSIIYPDTREEYETLEARFYLPLVSRTFPLSGRENMYRYSGLLLQRSGPGTYRRTGVWDSRVNYEEVDSKILKIRLRIVVLE